MTLLEGGEGVNVTDCREDEICQFYMSNAQFEIFRPRSVCISMKQGNCVPAVPVVAVGDYVTRGQKIGEGTSFLSMPVFASISGHVSEIFQRRQSVYETVSFVVIQADLPQQICDSAQINDEKDLIAALKNMGIIGMNRNFPARSENLTLCLGAFDREPMVYAQYRLIVECPAKVLFGARVMAKALGCPHLDIFVCQAEIRYILERAIHSYKKALLPLEQIRFFGVPEDIYGRNRILYEKSPDRLWFEPSHLAAVYDSFYDHKPMTSRGISIAGRVRTPKNLWVPNGAYVRDLLEYCKGFDGEADMEGEMGFHVIEGGPLRGHCVDIENASISLTTESLTVLPWDLSQEEKCISCQDCAHVCPAGLKPFRIEKMMEKGMGAVRLAMAGECVECGWCSYVCPSHRRLKEKVAAAKKMTVSPVKKTVGREDGTGGSSGGKKAGEGTDNTGDAYGESKVQVRAGGTLAAQASDYIDLDPVLARTMETLVPVSHGGPYLHGKNNIHALRATRLRALTLIFILYVCVAGPQVLVKALCAGSVFGLLLMVAPGTKRSFGLQLLWASVEGGMLCAMALAFVPSLKWPVVCGVLFFLTKKYFSADPFIMGIGLTMLTWAITGPMETENVVILSYGWLAVWIYMLFKQTAVWWTTVLFLLGYAAFGWISGGMWPWTATVFMGAVVFANSYKNGGKGSSLQRLSGLFSGLFAGILSLLFPVEAGVFVSLLGAHIIACNLMAHTI